MKALTLLATSALLGTEHHPPKWPQLGGAVGDLLRTIPTDPPARALLRMAGVLGTCQLSGWVAAASTTGPVPRAEDDPPRAPIAGGPLQTLVGILAEGPERLRAEAFQRLGAARKSVPHRLLPRALDCGRQCVALRPFLLPVIGPRGVWLASQSAPWAYAAGGQESGPSVDGAWTHGSLEQPDPSSLKLVTAADSKTADLGGLLDQFLKGLPLGSPPLSVATATKMLQVVKQRVHSGQAQHDWQLRSSLVELACVLPAESFDECTRGWALSEENVKPFVPAIARATTVIGQRKSLLNL